MLCINKKAINIKSWRKNGSRSQLREAKHPSGEDPLVLLLSRCVLLRFMFVRPPEKRESAACCPSVFLEERDHTMSAAEQGKSQEAAASNSPIPPRPGLCSIIMVVCVCGACRGRKDTSHACDGWMDHKKSMALPNKLPLDPIYISFIYSQVNGPRVIWLVWFCFENHS